MSDPLSEAIEQLDGWLVATPDEESGMILVEADDIEAVRNLLENLATRTPDPRLEEMRERCAVIAESEDVLRIGSGRATMQAIAAAIRAIEISGPRIDAGTSYDELADVLYVSFPGGPKPAVCTETSATVLWRKGKDGSCVGLTIVDAMHQAQQAFEVSGPGDGE